MSLVDELRVLSRLLRVPIKEGTTQRVYMTPPPDGEKAGFPGLIGTPTSPPQGYEYYVDADGDNALRRRRGPTGEMTATASQPISGTVTSNVGTGTQPVSGTVNANVGTVPVTGAFYPGTQPVSGTVTANVGTGTQPVSGTFYPGTQPVSGTFYQSDETKFSADCDPLASGCGIGITENNVHEWIPFYSSGSCVGGTIDLPVKGAVGGRMCEVILHTVGCALYSINNQQGILASIIDADGTAAYATGMHQSRWYYHTAAPVIYFGSPTITGPMVCWGIGNSGQGADVEITIITGQATAYVWVSGMYRERY